MKGTAFHIVDVSAAEKYAGNQLAVFRDAGGLSSEVMQKLAKEMERPSLIFLRAQNRDGTIHVEAGGKVVLIAQGRLL